MEIDNFERFSSPSTICIVGPTGSGKSVFAKQFIENTNKMFPKFPPKKILYCYGIYQPLFEEMEREIPYITFQHGLPSEEILNDFASSGDHCLCIIDDLMNAATKNEDVELLFTQKSHHMNISVIFISQNLFNRNKNARTISLNTHYYILFKNFRDGQQIKCLARQIYPSCPRSFVYAYEDATRAPYGYLYVNMSPHAAHNDIRLMSNIFDEDIIVYKCG